MLATARDDPFVEKRKNNGSVSGVSIYNPGIIRIEKEARAEYLKHDNHFSNHDPEKWQTDYSLLEHCIVVSRISAESTSAAGHSERTVLIARVGGLFHDIGKLDEICHLYRLNRDLSGEEKGCVDLHADISADYVLSQFSQVRREDRKFLHDVSQAVRFHHRPWELDEAELRIPAWFVHASDIFRAVMENRHRPGLSQFEAAKILPEVVEKRVPASVRESLREEFEQSTRVISGLYGIENVGLETND